MPETVGIHMIRQQCIEAETSGIEMGNHIQEKISRIASGEMTSLLQKILDMYIPGEKQLFLSKVELDLGHIPEENFETHFLEKFREKAIAYFRKLNTENIALEKHRTQERKKEALFYYLLYGSFPWWVKPGRDYQPYLLMHFILENNPVEFVKFLRVKGEKVALRKRLASQFRKEQAEKIIHLLEPAHAEIILKYADNFIRIQEEKKQVQAEKKQFEQATYEFIFHYLLAEKSSRFEEKSYLRSLVRQMASRFNLDYRTLLASLAETALDMPSAGPDLPVLLREIYFEETDIFPRETEAWHESSSWLFSTDPAYKKRAGLVFGYFLRHGSLHEQVMAYGHEEFEQWVIMALKAYPREMLRILIREGKNPHSLHILVHTFSSAFLQKLVSLLEPEHNQIVLHTFHQLETVVTPGKTGNKKAWELIFDFLLNKKTDRFREKTFLKYLLLHLAREEKNTGRLLDFLSKASGHPHDSPSGLPLALQVLEAVQEKAPVPATHKYPADVQSQIDLLYYYLMYGRLPWWETGASIQDIISFLAHQHPEKLLMQLGHYKEFTGTIWKFSALLSPGDFQVLMAETNMALGEIYLQAMRYFTTKKYRQKLREMMVCFTVDSLHKRLHEKTFRDHLLHDGDDREFAEAFLRFAKNTRVEYHDAFMHYMQASLTEELPYSPKTGRQSSREDINHTGVSAFSYFIRNGIFPAWAPENLRKIKPAEMLSLLSKEAEKDLSSCLHNLTRREMTRKLLVQKLPDDALTEIVKILYPRSFQLFTQQLSSLKKLVHGPAKATEKHHIFWNAAFASLSKHQGLHTREMLRQLQPDASSLKKILKKEQLHLHPMVLSNGYLLAEPGAVKKELHILPGEEKENGIYIRNAGLILLWPFLSQCFEKLGLTEENKFSGPEQVNIAVHLLQYMATGHTGHHEYELSLNKILCGLSADEAIPAEIVIPEKAALLADDLLETIIRQWSIIGNTSVEGLRESFLLRPGKLVEISAGYQLLVERRSFDVLLSGLPWPIGMVRLPWMNKILYVTWK